MGRINISAFLPRRAYSSQQELRAVLPFEAIPGPKPLPLIGNIWRYLPIVGDYDINNLYKNAQTNRSKYGPIVREQITRNHVILHLFDPNDIEAFFRQDSKLPNRRSHRALLKLRHENPERYNDGGIFPENGPNWSRVRSIFNQYLMRETVIGRRAKILDDITMGTIRLINTQRLDPPTSIRVANFEKHLYRWSVKCGLAVFLDFTNSNMPDDSTLDRIIDCSNDQLEALAGTEIKSDRWVRRPDRCPFYQKLSREEDFIYGFVEGRVNHLIGTKSANDVSFVQDWLVNDKLDSKDVVPFLIDCLTANLHTTVYTCMFLLENISRRLDTDLRDRLQSEISKVPAHGALDGRIIADINDRMPILRDCLRETLRLHPVSIGTGRLTQHDMFIGSYRVPKDVMVIAHNQVISRDSNIYECPNEFQPDRWVRYKSMSRSSRPSAFAFLPFGFGPRACIGQRLVSLQLYILTMRIFQSFDLTFAGDIKTRTTLVHHLDGEIAVELHPTERNRSIAC